MSYKDEKDKRAIEIVENYLKKNYTRDRNTFVTYIVWKSKVLQNWKYMIATSLMDFQYYEVTYNGNAEKWYLDVYEKQDNEVIED